MPTLTLPEQFGRYRILQKLGAGGMGAVYLAQDGVMARRVALKVPHFAPEDGPEVIERFYREARVAADVHHPNICPVYDIGEVGGIHYLTMPYLEGSPLSQLIDPDRPWPPTRAAALVCRLASALEVLHTRGLIHRDLKPSNVLVRPDGEPVLLDLGLARSFTDRKQRLTATGRVLGTPAYMSPEQVVGAQGELGPATDVYSLGVILYELLTGLLPFVGPLEMVCAQVLHAVPRLPSGLRPGLPPELDALCLKAMAKKPEERYGSMAQLAAAVQDWPHHGEPPPTDTFAPTLGRDASFPASTRMTAGAPTLPPLPAAPAPESQRFRHIRLVTRLRQLLDCHQAVTRRPQILEDPGVGCAWAFWLGIAGFFVGILAAASMKLLDSGGAVLAPVFSLSLPGGFFWLRLRWWYKARARARQDLSAKIDEVVAEFPQEVQALGGPAVLREPAILQELVLALEAPRSEAAR
jgi:serine/threonine protein kinase